MIYTCPSPEEIPETPDTGVEAGQPHLCVAAALGLIKGINDNVNILASKFGLESMDITDINNVAAKRQSGTSNVVYDTCEKRNGLTYTITRFPNILDKLPTDSPDIITGSLTDLRELSATAAAMKTNCNEMFSPTDKVAEHARSFSRFSQEH
ncbi:MAG: hypothetical protein FWB78_10345 [Treponema sp.]|nr:hypothetical protein [Treponema sp.]